MVANSSLSGSSAVQETLIVWMARPRAAGITPLYAKSDSFCQVFGQYDVERGLFVWIPYWPAPRTKDWPSGGTKAGRVQEGRRRSVNVELNGSFNKLLC